MWLLVVLFFEESPLWLKFVMDVEVRTSVQKIFEEIPLEEFKTLIVKWQKCIRQGIQQNGKYFEKVSTGDESISDSD